MFSLEGLFPIAHQIVMFLLLSSMKLSILFDDLLFRRGDKLNTKKAQGILGVGEYSGKEKD
jgi:hypothetical protein